MSSYTQSLKVGDKRVNPRFAFFPRVINNQKIWFEWFFEEEEWQHSYVEDTYSWVVTRRWMPGELPPEKSNKKVPIL